MKRFFQFLIAELICLLPSTKQANQRLLIEAQVEIARLNATAISSSMTDLASAISTSGQVSEKALVIIDKFLDSFKVSDPIPTTSVVREEDEVRSAMERWNWKPEELEREEINPFSVRY